MLPPVVKHQVLCIIQIGSMTYNLLNTISILLILHYCSSRVNPFVARRTTDTFRSYSIDATARKTSNLCYEPLRRPTHDMHCCYSVAHHPRHPRRNTIQWRLINCECVRYRTQLYLTRNDDTSFDFSSKLGWEEYYRKGLTFDSICDNDSSTSATSITTEWHTSIPLETIASYCWNSVNKDNSNESKTKRTEKFILMIGCGTSRLVDVVMAGTSCDSNGLKNTHITLLDSSQTCIDELQRRYKSVSNIHYICGDAIELSNTVSCSRKDTNAQIPQRYDTIVDKGLMDVLFCSDDWTSSVQTLFTEATKVLIHSDSGGTYILISYQLPKATKNFLQEIADELGYAWEFNCYGSTKRVSISTAKPKKETLGV